jgi:hypothetical protein
VRFFFDGAFSSSWHIQGTFHSSFCSLTCIPFSVSARVAEVCSRNRPEALMVENCRASRPSPMAAWMVSVQNSWLLPLPFPWALSFLFRSRSFLLPVPQIHRQVYNKRRMYPTICIYYRDQISPCVYHGLANHWWHQQRWRTLGYWKPVECYLLGSRSFHSCHKEHHQGLCSMYQLWPLLQNTVKWSSFCMTSSIAIYNYGIRQLTLKTRGVE